MNRYSVLPALSLGGILSVTVVEGSVTGDVYEEFIAKLLEKMQPYPGSNSVLIMDNAKIHKTDELREMVSRA